MQATLKFNLPEDHDNFEKAVRAKDFKLSIDEFLDWIRSKIKYTDLPEEDYRIYKEVQDQFYSILGENGINDFF
jgi:hypothetical protein